MAENRRLQDTLQAAKTATDVDYEYIYIKESRIYPLRTKQTIQKCLYKTNSSWQSKQASSGWKRAEIVNTITVSVCLQCVCVCVCAGAGVCAVICLCLSASVLWRQFHRVLLCPLLPTVVEHFRSSSSQSKLLCN